MAALEVRLRGAVRIGEGIAAKAFGHGQVLASIARPFGGLARAKDTPNLSPAVLARLKSAGEIEYWRWQKRDLSARHHAYGWGDGVRVSREPSSCRCQKGCSAFAGGVPVEG